MGRPRYSCSDGCVHGDIAAALLLELGAEREVVARHRHPGLPFQLARPVAEIVAVPGRLRGEGRQPEPLPDCARLLHELALG